jgi:uncharacterized protein YjiS (DUF1127 family)
MTAQKFEIGAPYGVADEKLPATVSNTATGILAFLAGVATSYIRYRTLRKAEMELHALDDRMLSDIGINRGEISSTLVNAGNERRRNIWRI